MQFLFAADAGHSREREVVNRSIRAGFDVIKDREWSHKNNPPQVAWSLAVIPIIEVSKTDPEGICVGDSISLKPDKANTLYMDYNSFVNLLVAQGGDSGGAFKGNRLTPRIQMPAGPFKAKASDYIVKFMREMGARHEIEVMEAVIEQLSMDFVVSRQAAKIRMVELGFEAAVGTFTFVDGHYVPPHS